MQQISVIGDCDTKLISAIEFEDLKGKVWSLESENYLMSQKLLNLIEEKQKSERELRNINFQLVSILKEVKPNIKNEIQSKSIGLFSQDRSSS